MHAFALALVLVAGPLSSQTPAPAGTNPADTQSALTQALLGHWIGVLEYRDYSEPPSSTKRVQLPTWLTISKATQGVFLDTTYDDGPSKILFEHEALDFDFAARTYKVIGTDSVLQSYTISGLDTLINGRGTLLLTGRGTDNNRPAEIRTTWTIRLNLLSWLEEVRPSGSSDPFTFRHRYTFTRADPPPLQSPSSPK